MEQILDFLETPIEEGVRGIHVHSYGHHKDFKKVTIVKIESTRKYGDSVGIITDKNIKIGWTYPSRIIVQKSLKIKI